MNVQVTSYSEQIDALQRLQHGHIAIMGDACRVLLSVHDCAVSGICSVWSRITLFSSVRRVKLRRPALRMANKRRFNPRMANKADLP